MCNLGTVYVFTPGTFWSFQSKILAQDGITNDNFGASIYISDTMAFIGSPSTVTSPNRGM
jgi:hypothetical protein